MSSRLRPIVQESFEAGAFTDVAPDLIPQNGLLELIDGWLEEDGGVIERGGTVFKSNVAFGDSLRWIWDGYFEAGQRTVFANDQNFGVLAADDETPVDLGSDGLTNPKPSAYIPLPGGSGLLFIGGGYIYAGARKAAYSTGTVDVTAGDATVTGSGTSWTANVEPGMLFQHGDERVYVVASITDNTHLELTENYAGTTDTGEAYTLSSLYPIRADDPYPDADFYGVCANRLIWATGNLVHASQSSAPHDLTATIGADEVPLVHELPEGVRVTGVGTVGQMLLVFTTHGVWTIEGLAFDIVDPDGGIQHRLQRHSGEVVLWDGNGIASWEQALVVPCIDGIWLLDGVSQPVRISHPVDQIVIDYIEDGVKCGQAMTFRGHYLLPIYSGSVTMRDLLVWRIDRPISSGGQTVYPFSRFSEHASDLIGFALRVGEDTREPILLAVSAAADARIIECPFFQPDAQETTTDADGEVVYLDLVTRDFSTGNGTKNVVQWVRIRSEELGNADPALAVAWSDGGSSGAGARFDIDHFDIATFGESGVTYSAVSCRVKEEAAGVRVYRCRVNKFRRKLRLRLRSQEETSLLKIRSVELFVRPSGAGRH